MYTQVELISTNDEIFVYWINNDVQNHSRLKTGVGIRILEVAPYLRVNRIFTTLKNLSDLPTKHRLGTIVEIN